MLGEAQSIGWFDAGVLGEVLWREIAARVASRQRLEALRQVSAVAGAGKDALARVYVAMAGRDCRQPGGLAIFRGI